MPRDNTLTGWTSRKWRLFRHTEMAEASIQLYSGRIRSCPARETRRAFDLYLILSYLLLACLSKADYGDEPNLFLPTLADRFDETIIISVKSETKRGSVGVLQ